MEFNFNYPSSILIFSDSRPKDSKIKLNRYLGPYRIGTELKQLGWEVNIIDFFHYFTIEEICEIIKNDTSKYIGFSVTFLKNKERNKNTKYSILGLDFDSTSQLLDTIKKYNKKIILGGSYKYDVDIETIFYQFGPLEDYFIKTFDFSKCKTIWEKNHFIKENEFLPIEIARGCIFKCKFCEYNLNGKKLWDFVKSVDVIKEEMLENYYNYNITKYFFCDDCFNDSYEKILKIKEMFLTLPFKIEFVCWIRLDILYKNQNMLKDLVDMGMVACNIGIESLNQKTCNIIGKPLDVEKVKKKLLEMKEYKNLIVFCSLIAGLPFESKESVLDTINFFRKNKIFYSIAPLFLTGIFLENFKKYGYERIGENGWKNIYWDVNECTEFLKNEKICHGINNLFGNISEYTTLRMCGISHSILKNLYKLDSVSLKK